MLRRTSWWLLGPLLRGRTATQHFKRGSKKVLGRVLGKGSQKGSEKGAFCGFYSKKGSEKGVSRRCLERPLAEYAPLGVRPRLGLLRCSPVKTPQIPTKSACPHVGSELELGFAAPEPTLGLGV